MYGNELLKFIGLSLMIINVQVLTHIRREMTRTYLLDPDILEIWKCLHSFLLVFALIWISLILISNLLIYFNVKQIFASILILFIVLWAKLKCEHMLSNIAEMFDFAAWHQMAPSSVHNLECTKSHLVSSSEIKHFSNMRQFKVSQLAVSGFSRIRLKY